MRELARAAGARLRELPSAAAQQDEETTLVVRGSCPRPQRNCCVADKSRGTTYGDAILQQGESRCVLKATPSASRQLPREGAVYGKIHVVGKFSRPIDFISTRYPGNTTKGSLSRELARAAGARLRELPSAAAQQDEETNLVVRGSCPPPQRNCCVAAKSRGTTYGKPSCNRENPGAC